MTVMPNRQYRMYDNTIGQTITHIWWDNIARMFDIQY